MKFVIVPIHANIIVINKNPQLPALKNVINISNKSDGYQRHTAWSNPAMD